MPNKNQRAFTLIEIITALMIIAVIFAAAFPNLRRFNQGQDLDANTSSLAQAIKLAQSNAMSNISCGVNPTKGWKITLTTNTYKITGLCTDLTNSTLTPLDLPVKSFAPTNITSSNKCLWTQTGDSMEIIFEGNTARFNCPVPLGTDAPLNDSSVSILLSDSDIEDCISQPGGDNCATVKVTTSGIITKD